VRIIRSISSSSRVVSVSELKSGEAVSIRRIMDVGVLPECDHQKVGFVNYVIIC
jgi:hypothetical protein